MSYCLNPDCRKPQNPGSFKFCQNCGTSLLLGDRYRTLKLIGQGGFGRTFLAMDEGEGVTAELEQPNSIQNLKSSSVAAQGTIQNPKSLCVIKQLLPRSVSDPQRSIALFQQEAERLAELGQHPQIPRLLAHFEFETAQYLVQEYIEGRNLEEVLKQDGVWSERQVRDLLIDLLPVLQFIHQRQIIHRDIKPANIIRAVQRDRYVLVDFGAAKTATVSGQTGTVIGSAGYVAPEQAMGKAEFASDLYSLGVTCVHLLTGLHPFDLYSISEDAWVWHQYLPRPVSGRLRRLLDKLLQKATSQRYHTAAEVWQDLGIASRSPASPVSPVSPTSAPAPAPSPAAVAAKPVSIWNPTQRLTGHEGEITALAVSPAGRVLASGSRDQSIKFWSLPEGELLHTIPRRSLWSGEGHSGSITALAFSPRGDTLISGSEDGTIKWWDLEQSQLICTLPSHGWGISSIAFHPKEEWLVCGSSDGLIQLWDLYHQELITNFSQHTAQVSSLIFSPDRRTLFSSSYDRTIKLWNLKTGDVSKTLSGHLDRVSGIALSGDGRTLVSGSWDKTVKLWDLDYAEQRKVVAAHKQPITCLTMHPKGNLFATGSEDSTVKLWKVETGERRFTLKSYWGVNAIVFSPDGKTLISGSADEVIYLWQRDRRRKHQ